MTKLDQSPALEPRWPIVLIILLVFALSMLPGRVRVFPYWFVCSLAGLLIVPLVMLHFTSARERWLRIENIAIVLFVTFVAMGVVLDLKDLFVAMITPPHGLTGIQLLNSSIGLWSANVMLFSVVYWRLDRGGADARAHGLKRAPDWRFPREEADDDMLPDWHPTYVDYLFLAFCTATAFSPTEALPMTSRAKLLMMAESSVALIVVLAIASRAIGLLGS